jgi:predicted ATPase
MSWARLVPELGPRDAAGNGPLEPSRLFELLLGMLHRIAERTPVLLVVEDLHWADQSTRDLLGFLVRNLRSGVALVMTCRSDEPYRGHPLRSFLPEPAQRVLAAAAVAGSRVDHELLAAVTGLDDGQLVPRLREAVAHHLLAVDEASGGYVFRHALVQEAVYGELLPAQRRPLHAAYARALDRRSERRGGDADASAVELGQLAYHW